MVALLSAACTGRDIISSPGWMGTGVSSELLVTGTLNGRVVALDPQSGARRWRFPADGEAAVTGLYGQPLVTGDGVVIGDYDGTVYALDTQGASLWKYATGGPIVGGPVLADDLVLVSSSDGSVYALRAANGRADPVWDFPTRHKVWAPPAVANGTVYVASMDHTLYALSLSDGSLKWQVDTEGALATRPLMVGDLIVVGSFDSTLYGIRATGEVAWRFPASHWFYAPAVTDGQRIFAGTLDGRVYALDLEGRELWSVRPGDAVVAAPVVLSSGLVVVTDSADNTSRLSILDPATGQERWAYHLDARARAPLAHLDPVVFLSTLDGRVHAVDTELRRELWSQPVQP